MARQAQVARSRRRKNPESDASAMYESFHGRPAEELLEFEEQEHYHENLAELGVLVELRVETVTGLKRAIEFEVGDEGDGRPNPSIMDRIRLIGHKTTLHRVGSGVTTTTTEKYKGYALFKRSDGRFEVPQIDRESVFDTKKDAQRFVDDEVGLRRSNPELYADQAYGNQFEKRGKQWYARFSFRDPHFNGKRGEDFGPWKKASKEIVQSLEQMIRSGKVVKTNPGPISSAAHFAGDVSGLNKISGYVGRATGVLDRKLGKVIGFKGNGKPTPQEIVEGLKKWIPELEAQQDALLEPGTRTVIRKGKRTEYFKLAERIEGAKKNLAFYKRVVARKVNPTDSVSTATTLLCSNETGTQLYFIGGDQSIDLDELKFTDKEQEKELITVGTCTFVSYFTKKDFDKFQPIVYEHDLAEETGVFPTLIYDRLNKRLMLAGGAYYIPQPMFETSGGIHD